jgi:hypothetical protein
MPSPAVQLATAVADSIESVMDDLWTDGEAHVTRSYRPVFDLEDLDVLQITVTPAAMDMAPIGRGEWDRRLGVLVAVQRRCGSEDTERLDDLAGLVQGITDHLTDRRLDGHPEARFEGVETDPLYHPDVLETKRVFLAPSLVKYRIL